MTTVFATDRARRYVRQSPQTKNLCQFAQGRLIKGIAKLLSDAYARGYIQGRGKK
jgi:hypothetical protein